MNKKEQLAAALKDERDRLPEVSRFGDENDLEGTDLTIHYLLTGEYNKNDLDTHDMLYQVVEDFDDLYDLYCG